jgi:outer membrane protein
MRFWTPGLLVPVLLSLALTSTEAAETRSETLETRPEVFEGLSLEQAIAIALDESHMVAIASAQVDAAEGSVDAANSYRLPKVDLIENFSWTTNPVYVFGNLLGQEAFTAAHFDPAFLNEPDALSNFQTQIRITQPIYTGGAVRSGLEAARAGSAAAQAEQERTRQEVVHNVLEAYSGAVLAGRHLGVARAALKTSRAHGKLVEDIYRAGLVVESDLLQVKVRITEIEEMVIRAESAVAVAAAGLNMVMGVPLSRPYTLMEPCTAGSCGVEALAPLAGLVEEAVAHRPDLKAAKFRQDAAAEMHRVARSSSRPEVGVSGIYEANAEDFIAADGTNYSVMVGARFRLFDGRETRAGVARADAERRMAAHASEMMAQAVELEVMTTWHELRASTKSLEKNMLAVEMAGAALKIVEDRYKEGLTTLVELMEAETALTSAQTREVAARRDLLLADASLKLAVGRL